MFSGPSTHSGTETFANINKVVYADQQAGATADVKITNCFAALPSGGTCDARGFGATTQSIVATVTVSVGITLLLDPVTKFQAASSSLNLFTVEPNAVVDGLTFDCTNQPGYSGIVFQNDNTVAYVDGNRTRIDNITINSSCQTVTTGAALQLSSTSLSLGVSFLRLSHWRVYGLQHGRIYTATGTGFVNGVNASDWVVSASSVGYQFQTPSGTSPSVGSNIDVGDQYELNTCTGSCIGFNYVATAGTVSFNDCLDCVSWDTTAPVTFTGSGAKGNLLIGRFDGTITDTPIANDYINEVDQQFIFNYSVGTFGNGLGVFGTAVFHSSPQIGGPILNIGGTVSMGLTPKTGSGAGNYTGANTAAFISVDTTNLCTAITVPTGWKLKVDVSGVLESVTAAVSQSVALVDAGTTCTGGGVTALTGTRRDITPSALGTFDVNFAMSYVFTGDGAAHSISLAALTSNAADSWGIQNTSASAAPSMTFTLMPSN